MLKRVFDVLASVMALLLLSPVIAIVAWQISQKMGSPVLFRQTRPGKDGKPFQMVKFRTMKDAADAEGNPLPDSERMTPLGQFLRSSSLDELPELWNVLKGEMSLVGPRPLLMEYLPLYSKEQYRRHEVRPGVTGWAQINGRNAISWEEKFKLDVWYVDNHSLWLDVKILFFTVKKVLVRDGISADGEATMPMFEGFGAERREAVMDIMKRNILVSSAGRRVELIKAFQGSLLKKGVEGCVLATDMEPELSAACQAADEAFKVPSATAPNYVEVVLEICKARSVGLLIPTIDTELLVLAENVESFKAAGVEIAISDLNLIKDCRDKRKSGELFLSLGVPYPEIYPKDALKLPCFCKPYDGSRSVGAMALFSEAELTPEVLDNPKNIFMELVPDTYCEYTVDGYYNRNGELCSLVCRERLEVRSGEVSKGVSRKDFVYDYLVDRLKKLPGARGCITFQFFVHKDSGNVIGLEINPRFGGGYPLTHQSGSIFTDYLVREYFLNESIVFFDDWQSDLLMLRYDAAVYKKIC